MRLLRNNILKRLITAKKPFAIGISILCIAALASCSSSATNDVTNTANPTEQYYCQPDADNAEWDCTNKTTHDFSSAQKTQPAIQHPTTSATEKPGPFEVLAYRVVWAIPCLLILLTATRQWQALFKIDNRERAFLLATGLCLIVNWCTFIWAVQSQRLAEASLGYFINPLINIVLGRLFLSERLRPLQALAVLLAMLGIGLELAVLKTLPWVGLVLAFSFGFYGLLRKQVSVPSAVGLSVETSLLAPFAILFLVIHGSGGEVRSLVDLAKFSVGGVVSVVPLVLFAAAAIRLPLTTLGFAQYIAPTISLMLAVFLYGEAVGDQRWGTFAMILAAFALLLALMLPLFAQIVYLRPGFRSKTILMGELIFNKFISEKVFLYSLYLSVVTAIAQIFTVAQRILTYLLLYRNF